MTRTSAVLVALLPALALAQATPDAIQDRAPLLPLWAIVSVILLATLVALLLGRRRSGARARVAAFARRRREDPSR